MASVSITDLCDSLLHDLGCNNPGLLAGCDVYRENRSIRVPPGSTGRQFAASALLRSVPSKFQDEIDKEDADLAAWELFHAANRACESWALRTEELGPYDEVIIGEFKRLVWDFFNPEGYPLLDLAAFIPFVDFGPGSSPGADTSDFVTKIGESRLSASSQLIIDLFYDWVKDHPTRVDCELTRSLSMGPPKILKAVSITAVPKKRTISRLVKPEPLLNMFFQKGVAEVLRRRLRDLFGIDLSCQPQINAEMARVGSIDRSFATIDLKSASDYLANGLCDWCIPRASLLWLKATRSSKARTDKGVAELHMMATMGNDFCFPLQTVIFTCVVLAVYKALGLPIRKNGKALTLYRDVDSGEIKSLSRSRIIPSFGVFGDDIVVLDQAYKPVCRFLRCLGFIPNMEKSFDSAAGNFRESCGADWIEGFNVRGVYCKSLRTIQDRYALINSLVDWSARTRISLPETINLLVSSVPPVLVPPWENPDSGIRAPERCLKEKHKVYKCFRAHKGLELQGSYLYKRYVAQVNEKPCDPDSPLAITKGCYWNSSAVFLAAIKGHCRGGTVSLRMFETPYRKRLGVAPCWDYIPPQDERYVHRKIWFDLSTAYFED